MLKTLKVIPIEEFMESPILEVEGDRESGLSYDNESDVPGSDSEEVLFEFC